MVWLVLGSLALCGAVMTILPDTKLTPDRGFLDRSRLRRAGMMLLGLSGTALLGLAILMALANWVSSDL